MKEKSWEIQMLLPRGNGLLRVDQEPSLYSSLLCYHILSDKIWKHSSDEYLLTFQYFSPVIKVGKAADRNPNRGTMSRDSDDDWSYQWAMSSI